MRTQGHGQTPSSMQTLFPLSNKQVSVNYVFFPLAFPLSHVCLNSLQLPQHVSVFLFKSTANCFYSIYRQFLVKVHQIILFDFNLDIYVMKYVVLMYMTHLLFIQIYRPLVHLQPLALKKTVFPQHVLHTFCISYLQ